MGLSSSWGSSILPMASVGIRRAGCVTLEEVDSLIAVEAVCWEGKGSVNVIGDTLKALGDVAWVSGVQGSVIKAPVPAALGRSRQVGKVTPGVSVLGMAMGIWGHPEVCGYICAGDDHTWGHPEATMCMWKVPGWGKGRWML